MQTGVSMLDEAPSTVNEDCLYLNLWTPAFTNPDGKVLYLGDSITVDGVANINNLRVFDAVYATVRGKPLPHGSVGSQVGALNRTFNNR